MQAKINQQKGTVEFVKVTKYDTDFCPVMLIQPLTHFTIISLFALTAAFRIRRISPGTSPHYNGNHYGKSKLPVGFPQF